MPSRQHSRTRALPFGPLATWAAFTDEVLLQGWLAPVVEVRPDGTWLERIPILGGLTGVLSVDEDAFQVRIPVSAGGELVLAARGLAPGSDGGSRTECEIRLLGPESTDWPLADLGIGACMDALEALLRGRPRDW